MAELLRSHVGDLEPIYDIGTLEAFLAQRTWTQRVFGSIFGVFAFIALVLAMVGLYAVSSYSVAQRTREIGVRMALGAQRSQVRRLVTRRAALQLVIGLAFGLAAAVGVGLLLRGVVPNVGGIDVLALVAICGLLILTTLVACLVPARRATNINPVTALRAE